MGDARRGGFIRHVPFVLGALLLAGLVHGMSVLLLPYLALDAAAARLSRGAVVNRLDIVTRPDVGNRLDMPQPGVPATADMPFSDPFMLSAVCRFDVSEEPLRLRIPTGDHFMSVVVITDAGRVVLGLTDKAASRRQLDMLLATPAQIRQLEAQDAEDEPVQELRVPVPTSRGLVLLKALRPLASDGESVRALLARAICRGQAM